MWFMRSIVNWLGTLESWFEDAYLEVSSWVFPFNHLATPLWWVFNAFKWLKVLFTEFDEWLVYVRDKLLDILSELDIWSILSVPIKWASDAWNWVKDAPSFIWNIITDWWGTISSTVLGWIDIVKQWLFDRIEDVKALANRTSSDLANFFTVTLPQLVGWGELDSIIISHLRTWFPMYNSFCLLWDSIEEFFADPLEWIYNRLEDFFERYW